MVVSIYRYYPHTYVLLVTCLLSTLLILSFGGILLQQAQLFFIIRFYLQTNHVYKEIRLI